MYKYALMRFIVINWKKNQFRLKQMNFEVTQTNSTATTEHEEEKTEY